jgi:hypothetical protein
MWNYGNTQHRLLECIKKGGRITIQKAASISGSVSSQNMCFLGFYNEIKMSLYL